MPLPKASAPLFLLPNPSPNCFVCVKLQATDSDSACSASPRTSMPGTGAAPPSEVAPDGYPTISNDDLPATSSMGMPTTADGAFAGPSLFGEPPAAAALPGSGRPAEEASREAAAAGAGASGGAANLPIGSQLAAQYAKWQQDKLAFLAAASEGAKSAASPGPASTAGKLRDCCDIIRWILIAEPKHTLILSCKECNLACVEATPLQRRSDLTTGFLGTNVHFLAHRKLTTAETNSMQRPNV